MLFSSLGGNGAFQNSLYNKALPNINGVVDALQNANPEVTIIIEQLAPTRSKLMTNELTSYFNRQKQDLLTIASENSTTSSKIIALDMFTGFSDSLLEDNLHFNEASVDFIANRYYTVIKNILEE